MSNQAAIRVLSPTVYDRTLEEKALPKNSLDVWIGRWPAIPYLRVCWHTAARLKVLEHCYRTPDVEVGGVLLGGVYRTPETGGPDDLPIDFIEITNAIPATVQNSGVGHIEFPPESWAEINRIRDRKYPSLQILGWYHTHPGHEVFLSGHDLFIQNNFFNQEFQLALVIETHKHYGAFFVDSKLKKGPYRSDNFKWSKSFLKWCSQNINRTQSSRADVVVTESSLPREQAGGSEVISIDDEDLDRGTSRSSNRSGYDYGHRSDYDDRQSSLAVRNQASYHSDQESQYSDSPYPSQQGGSYTRNTQPPRSQSWTIDIDQKKLLIGGLSLFVFIAIGPLIYLFAPDLTGLINIDILVFLLLIIAIILVLGVGVYSFIIGPR